MSKEEVLNNILQKYEESNKNKKHQASTNIFLKKKPHEKLMTFKKANYISNKRKDFPKLYNSNENNYELYHHSNDQKITEKTATYQKKNNIINIINQVNEVSQDDNSNNKTIDLKMNINKYSIKCFVSSDAKFQHMFDGLELHHDNDNEQHNNNDQNSNKRHSIRTRNNTLFIRPQINDNSHNNKLFVSMKNRKQNRQNDMKKTKSWNSVNNNNNEENESDYGSYIINKGNKSSKDKSTKSKKNLKMSTFNDNQSNSHMKSDDIYSETNSINNNNNYQKDFIQTNRQVINNSNHRRDNSLTEKKIVKTRNKIINIKKNIGNELSEQNNIVILKLKDNNNKENDSFPELQLKYPPLQIQRGAKRTMSVIPKSSFMFTRTNDNELKSSILLKKEKSIDNNTKSKKKHLIIQTTPKERTVIESSIANRIKTKNHHREENIKNKSISLENHLQLNSSDINNKTHKRSQSNTTLNFLIKNRNSISIVIPSKKEENHDEAKVNLTPQGISAHERFAIKIGQLYSESHFLNNNKAMTHQSFFQKSNKTIGGYRKSDIIIQSKPQEMEMDVNQLHYFKRKRHTIKPINFSKSNTAVHFILNNHDKLCKDASNTILLKQQTTLMAPQTNLQEASNKYNTILSRAAKRKSRTKKQKTVTSTIAKDNSIITNEDESNNNTDELEYFVDSHTIINTTNDIHNNSNPSIESKNNNLNLKSTKSIMYTKHKKQKTHIQFKSLDRPGSQLHNSKHNYQKNNTLFNIPKNFLKSTKTLHYNKINSHDDDDDKDNNSNSSLSQKESVRIVTNIFNKIRHINNIEIQLNASISYIDIDLNSSTYLSSMKIIQYQENIIQDTFNKTEQTIQIKKNLLVRKSYNYLDSRLFNLKEKKTNIDYMNAMGFKQNIFESESLDLFCTCDHFQLKENDNIIEKVKKRLLEEYFNIIDKIHIYLFNQKKNYQRSTKNVKKYSQISILRIISDEIENPRRRFINHFLQNDKEIEIMQSINISSPCRSDNSNNVIKKFDKIKDEIMKKGSMKHIGKQNKQKYNRRRSLENRESLANNCNNNIALTKNKKGQSKDFSIMKHLNFRNNNNNNINAKQRRNSRNITLKCKGSLFSSQNKDITAIRTNEIKYTFTQLLGNDLHSKIAFYIKDQNFIKLNDLILKSFSKVNINYQDDDGNTFLVLAVRSNSYKICKYLLDKGANPNFCNNEHLSPLHFALNIKNFEIVNLLLENGANETAKALNGLTPWQCLEKSL